MIIAIAILCAISAANIITSEYIFQWLRNLIVKTKVQWLITLFHCTTCMSFWTGLVSGLCFYGFDWMVVAVALCSSLGGKLLKLFEGME